MKLLMLATIPYVLPNNIEIVASISLSIPIIISIRILSHCGDGSAREKQCAEADNPIHATLS